MRTEDDDNFDLLLQSHFAKELDGQLGRAPAAFARSSRRRPWRAFVLTTAGLAAAAMLTIALIQPVPDPSKTDRLAVDRPIPGEYQLAWQTEDRGTVFLDDDTPARSYVRRQVEVMRWTDPETGQPIEMTIPRDEILLIGLNTF